MKPFLRIGKLGATDSPDAVSRRTYQATQLRLIWVNVKFRPHNQTYLHRSARALLKAYGPFAEIEARERTTLLIKSRCFRAAQRWSEIRKIVRNLRSRPSRFK